nr:helix-turn-helix domain-containing protein [Sphingomonas turrisvirgatae]
MVDARVEPLAVRIPQAAQMLGIGKSKLYQFIAAGEIETVKVGRSTLVPTDSLKAFISSRRRST